jgi:hypothetical protein
LGQGFVDLVGGQHSLSRKIRADSRQVNTMIFLPLLVVLNLRAAAMREADSDVKRMPDKQVRAAVRIWQLVSTKFQKVDDCTI